MNSINMAIIFLTNTVFELYIYILILRLVLPLVGADFHNPLSQLTLSLTDPVIKPLKKIMPNVDYINLSVLLFLLFIDCLKLFIFVIIQYHIIPNIFGILIWAIADIFDLATNLMFMAIIMVVVLSWIGQNIANSVVLMLNKITEPYLKIFRKWIPPIAGLDLSPIAALIGLKLITIILIHPVKQIGFGNI